MAVVLIAACGGTTTANTATSPSPVAATPAPASPSQQPQASPSPQPPATTSSVTIKGFAFSPKSITISAGTTVAWTNMDAAAHTSTADAGGWDSDSIGNGGTFKHQFTSTGTFTYICTFHPNMKGTIVVS